MGECYMKNDFVKFSNGEYAYTDEFGKINLIKCDRGEDFVYILLCKEDELERLERENKMWMRTISRINGRESKRKKWNRNYAILVPFSVILFFILKTITLGLSLFVSLGLLGLYKLFINYKCGNKDDNIRKLDYANKIFNENREKIPVLKDEIKKLKNESNYRIVSRDDNMNTKNKYQFKGNSIVNNVDNVDIVHKVRILSK